MQELIKQIRDSARQLLEEGKVHCVIGYRQGSIPMRAQPYFAYTPEEADNLTWSCFCTHNLAKYLIGRKEPSAIVAQGCVTRNIAGLIQENQVKRENIFILGLNSPGMIDHRRVQARLPGKIIHEVLEVSDHLVISGPGFEEKFLKRDVKRDNCYTCTNRNPVIYDQLIGEKGEETGGGNIDKVAAPWEGLGSDERWKRFQETFKESIRCYACRDACPLCYCRECFVDESRPQWCGKTVDESDVYAFHILRAFHCAGRCTDCGACESACPVGIKMRRLTSKIEKDIREMYGFTPGLDTEAIPPLSVYRPDDSEEFMRK